ncbi:MAG: B12-binding domain-containing radical SAM protein [Syntrophaceae bacterium]|nr:B12-binding domain-containing radical SAM protein [Syntrophaceae bacterium]
MRIACVFNPFKYKLHEENLRVVQRYFGLFPPLSMAWVCAIAERAGHDALLIDARTLRLTKEDVLDRLKAWKPDILGFMMTTYMFRETLEWVQFLKKNLKVPVIIGGYNLRVYPQESVSVEGPDFGCFNSAYHTLPSLFKELEGQRRFHDVPGLIYKENGRIEMTPYGEDPNFDDYPNPARHLLPNDLYAEFTTERKNFTVMVTSKGCPNSCLFCEAGHTSYNPRSPETVLKEIKECYTRYKIREIDFFDYDFCIDRKRVEAICDGMIKSQIDISWACRTRVDLVDETLLRKMKAAGCSRIYFGIESGIQEILDRLHKSISLQQIRNTIEATKGVGIKALGFFLVGSPGETQETFSKTVKFAKSLNLDYVQFSKLTAKPLTPYWRQMVKDTGSDYWREYILGNIEEKPLPRPWTTLTNEEIDYLTKKAYIMYHCRPMFLLHHTLKVKSWSEFKRKFFAFIEMIIRQENISTIDKNFIAYPENKSKILSYKQNYK